MWDWLKAGKEDAKPSSRRAFLRGEFARSEPRKDGVLVLRPPGAAQEADFLEACTRCGDCVSACPSAAIFLAPARFRGAAGTPMIDPMRSPCVMCTEMACAVACPTDALQVERGFNAGTAMIQAFDCLAHTGSFCTTCAERCPEPAAVMLDAGRPRINPELCTGCGVCQHVCPAPNNAILVLPNRARARVSTDA